jgi:hypothetical protein
MLSWTKLSDATCCAQQKMKFARASREHGRESSQARAERQRQLGLERSTAAELGLPYAERVDLGVTWDAGTPMPVLLSGLRTFVAFYLSVHDPLFDGTSPHVRDPQADHGIGVVEFKRVTSVKIGSPNDEVLRGHPLWGQWPCLKHANANQV